MAIYKGKDTVCKHMGHEVNFSNTWWCNKQFNEPTEIHKNCDCKNCPDFEVLEWITLTTDPVLEDTLMELREKLN